MQEQPVFCIFHKPTRLPPPPTYTHCHVPTQVIYLGGGCLDAAPELREFVAKTQIPVASTLMGLGTFPGQDPLALQMLGMHGTVFANYSVDQVRAGCVWVTWVTVWWCCLGCLCEHGVGWLGAGGMHVVGCEGWAGGRRGCV